MPRGAGAMPVNSNVPSGLLSRVNSRSPWKTWIATDGWLSSAVVKVSLRLVGMAVLRSMSFVITPPLVSMPTRKSEVFSTAEDNQPSVEIHVLQGEREMATYNKSLGKFQLTGIPPAPRGIPQVEVTFDIDANGILAVSAKDLGTGKEQKIEIKAGSGLSDAEIRSMVSDAESHAEEDKRLRELAEARNAAESAAYQAEKQLKDLGEAVDEQSRGEITQAIADVNEAVKGEDADDIRAKTERLQTAFHRVSEQMYERAQAEQQQASQSGNGSSSGAAGGDDEEVVDAEVVDENR